MTLSTMDSSDVQLAAKGEPAAHSVQRACLFLSCLEILKNVKEKK